MRLAITAQMIPECYNMQITILRERIFFALRIELILIITNLFSLFKRPHLCQVLIVFIKLLLEHQLIVAYQVYVSCEHFKRVAI